MLKNYLLTAYRNVRRQKGYAFINVAGLSIGLACSFFILLWVMHEVSYDRFHGDGDRIYRVYRNVTINDEVFTTISTPRPMAEAMRTDYPEIENATNTWWGREFLITVGDQSYREEGNYASADFFQVFSFPLLEGDPATALQVENSVVITEKLAARLFGPDWREKQVLGRTLNLERDEDFTITGIAADVPDNSSIKFELVVPIHEAFAENPWTEHWGNNSFPLYVRLREGTSPEQVNAKIAKIVEEHFPETLEQTAFLVPFEESYLHGEYEEGINTGGRIELIRIFSVVALFLLVIASINFMNLATARSMQRSKEIGVRKAIGATQGSLAKQFMAESLMLAGVAFVLALALVVALLPAFNTITGKEIGLTDLSPAYLASILGIALVTGLLAGSYPALYLSSFNPVAILRGTFRQKPGEARLRKGLVVFQFALSTLIIVSTAAVYFQIRYIMEKDLGVDRGNVLAIRLEGEVARQYDTFRQELMKRAGVVAVSASDQNPLFIGSDTTDPTWDGKDPNDETTFYIINANYDFPETMKMELVAGRTWDRQFGADSSGYIINERTAERMGKENVIGERLDFWGRPGTVIGVVKDFHMTSLEGPIREVIMRLEPPRTDRLWMRTEPGQTPEALAGLEALYKQFNPGYPFEYQFMDQEYEERYKSVLVMGQLANVFAVIAVLISCLGLFGLASFTAERRTKEIGIRKVLGASASHLVMLLSADFTKLVLAGFVLAAPLAYWLIKEFLSSFEYRAEISPVLFVVAGVGALVIAWVTVSYQSFKAANADPVKSLRTE